MAAAESASRLDTATDDKQQDAAAHIRGRYYVKVPVPRLQSAITTALGRRGLVPTLPKDARCLLQWTTFSRIQWDPVLAGVQIASSFVVHSGLVNKWQLYELVHNLAATEFEPAHQLLAHLPHTVLVSKQLVHELGATDDATRWVLKESTTNNALGVHMLTTAELVARCEDLEPSSQQLLAQHYIMNPLTLHGSKFHIRVNVLAHGFCNVYVHRHMVFHVAVEKWHPGDWDAETVHITNHTVQRRHAGYRPELHTLTPSQFRGRMLEQDADSGYRCDQLFQNVCELVTRLFSCAKARPTKFLPVPNCFELYGLDVMVDDTWKLWLLEVNEGPALEAVAQPACCDVMVEDTLRIVLDPLLSSSPAAVPSTPAEFQLVWSDHPASSSVPVVFNAAMWSQVRQVAALETEA